jgi:LysR family nitrogen assimilation transcriptional regulator
MDINQLEAFVHVAELGSFTRAATILDMTQPALSRLVRQLEVELRQNLLVRNGRGVTVNEAGQLMLAHAKGILLQIERATDDLTQFRSEVGGHFNVGLTPSIAKVVTVELVRRIRERFPEATISVVEGLSKHLVEWLLMGRIDAAILYDTSNTPLIDKRTLFEEELFLIGRHGSATMPASVKLADIGHYPLVIPGRMHAIRHIVETSAAEIGTKLTIALEVDAVTSILDLVCDDCGHAVLPLNAIRSDPQRRQFDVTPIVAPTIRSRLTLATSTRHPLSQLAIRVIQMMERDILPLYFDQGEIRSI